MMRRLILGAVLTVLLGVSAVADTLVLRNGTRVGGQLVAVRSNVIEFEERRGSGSGRRVQFDRAEVLRIEFDTPGGNAGSARPFGMRERTAIVNANTAWTDTSVDVRAGQTISFEAAGEIRWGRDRRDGPASRRGVVWIRPQAGLQA